MRDFLMRSGRLVSDGWLWPLVLLALPGCGLYVGGIEYTPAFDPGPDPRSSAVMCYIPKPNTTQCATPDEVQNNFSTGQAGFALATGQGGSLALDYSNLCPNDATLPTRTQVYGSFPDGYASCLNCGTQMPSPYPDGDAVCVAQCKDLLHADGITLEEGNDAYCARTAHVAAKFDKTVCFDGACSSDGTPDPNFLDPRRIPEPVKWNVDPADGTQASNNDLQQIAQTSLDFAAGSEAVQVMLSGDGWVEFGANETTMSHVLGVSNCPFPCDLNNPSPDNDRTRNDIDFGIQLDSLGNVYVFENPGFVLHGPFGAPYTKDDRFRVNVVDKHDGTSTATISFSRLIGKCTVGTKCTEDVFFTSGSFATYPLRVDTSFREQNAKLTNVTIVRNQW